MDVYVELSESNEINICLHNVSDFRFFPSGREFFVGLSKRTNQRGAEILADAFKVIFNCLLVIKND